MIKKQLSEMQPSNGKGGIYGEPRTQNLNLEQEACQFFTLLVDGTIIEYHG